MPIHPDLTAYRAVDACGGTFDPKDEWDDGWSTGFNTALEAAGKAVAKPDALMAEMLALLQELTALVRGECPSLLNEDSGGDAHLSMAIDTLVAKAEGRS